MSKQRTHKKKTAGIDVEIGCGSVYADLGFKNHAEMETKSDLVIEIGKVIKKKKLTQMQAAEILNISQPKLCELLNGRFRGYSIERLMLFLNKLGKDVDIVVRSKPRNRRARVSVYHSSAEGCSKAPMAAKGR